jgi:hypothetical protein
MPSPQETYASIRSFVNFTDHDVANLVAIRPIVEKHGPAVTDAFYEVIQRTPATARFVEGRVDALKKTHTRWMMDLVAGDYGDAYFDSRWRIGKVHVRIGIDPFWPESVMSILRAGLHEALAREIPDSGELSDKYASLVKILDLDMTVINLSYAEDRLDRLTEFTGMKRALLENLIALRKD